MADLQATVGNLAEDAALKHLQANGLTLLTRNYRCKVGEIDLIMRDANEIAFVEVRYRKSSRYGTGLESVSSAKVRRPTRAAHHFLQNSGTDDTHYCRFDIMSVTGERTNMQFDWIKEAFST
jgi:putative endonuclease